MTIASLAMYPFIHLRSTYDQLWDGVRRQLSFAAPPLDWQLSADEACRRHDLLVGQTCGWPLITQLGESVRVIGTFDCDVEGGSDGTYCSVLVSGRDEPLADILRSPGPRIAANSTDSLSGWVSLRVIATANGVRLDEVEWTGSHAASVEAVRQRRADLASIDAVSWTHLDQTGLTVVGHGPRVPCLPLVTSGSSSDAVVEELRHAFTEVVSDATMADARATLRIRGFVDRHLADYEELSALAQLG